LESIIRQSITDHVIDNNAFSNKQFGFIQGKSTVMQLHKVVDMWTKSLESGGQIDVVNTDLEKAFDKVAHKRLISKLYSYKINPGLSSGLNHFEITEDKGLELMVSFPHGRKF